MLSHTSIDNLVLGTVNASWKRSIDADTLAQAVATVDVETWLIHLATFFTEVRSGLIVSFANVHGISLDDLFSAYTKVKALTGEANLHLENDLVELGCAA